MNKFLNLDLTRSLIDPKELKKQEEGLMSGQERLWSGKEEFTGWVRLPLDYNKAELQRILDTAEKIKSQCQAFIVIGIGGSYLGAKAAIAAIQPGIFGCGCNCDQGPEVYFAGQNISGTYHQELLEEVKDKDVCICVISKSGTTTEPSIAFSILKDFLYQKYGKEEAAKRIYAITDAARGTLRQEVDGEGYASFVIPDDIGGRYSVLTPVGLLPMAVAGIDIQEMLDGAGFVASQSPLHLLARRRPPGAKALGVCVSLALWQYAAARMALQERGKTIEVFEYFEPKLQYFAEWLKQLFGESHGKDGKGLFPAALQFSTDLHSMGQFLQEGNQIFFETVLNIVHMEKDIIVPESAGKPYAGKSMNLINEAAMKGTMAAHHATGVPIIKIDIPELTPYYFGQLIYFFETTCALSGYLMGVNPFDQPGVESYKEEMRKVLK